MRRTRTATGHISIVQEERFRLATPDGRVLLLTLAHDANVGAADLHDFRRRGTRLQVEYAGEPDFASAVAHRIRLATDRESGAIE